MANDLIKVLLGAEIDQNAINNIRQQINSIQQNIKPVNISVNATGTQSVSNMTNALEKLENVTKKNLLLDLERMSNRYKNLVKPEDISNIKSMITALNHTDPKLGYNIDLIRVKMKEVSVGAEQSRKSLDLANKSAMSFGEAMKTAAYKFGIWSAITASYYKLIREISTGIKFITEMNTALTEIGMVTNQNRAQTAALAKEYNNLAKEMKVLTGDITSGAVEFYRQGLSQKEVMDRLKVTTMYSKVANLEFKQSAELLTATVNSMGISIERAADVFLFLGDATATSGAEIGKGFSKVGGAASALGVEFEKVASWIAVISSKTRESAESIGHSINTILSRMSRITSTGFDEEDGTKINDVAKALSTVGVALMDEQGNFRNFGTILDEVALKFDSLSDKNKSFLANTLAGTRQQSRFFNLMNGYSESMKLYEQSLDSASTAQSKYNIYLESNRATLDKFRTTIEGLWITIINNDSLMNVVKSVTDFIESLDSLIQKFGVIGTVLNTVIPLIGIKLAWAIRAAYIEMIKLQATGSMTAFMPTSQAIGSLIKQFLGFKTVVEGATIATTGLTMATVGLTAGLIAIPMIINAIATAESKRKIAMEETLEAFQRQKDISSNMDDLIKSYEELSNKTKLTSEESQKLLDIKTKIKDLLPNSASAIDNENLSLGEQVLILKDLNEQELQNAKLRASESLLKYGKNLDYYKQKLDNTTESLNSMNERLSTLQLKQASGQKLTRQEAEDMAFLIDWIQMYNKSKEDTESKIKLIEDSYDILNSTINDTKKKNEGLNDSLKDNANAFILLNKQIEENNKLFEDTTSKIQQYNVFLSELNTKEGLSAKSKEEIIKQYKELLPYISNEQELRQQLIKIIGKEEEIQKQAYVNMLMYSEDFFNAKIQGNSILIDKLGEFYSKDLENAKSLAEAKQKVEEALMANLSKKWAKYYDAQSQSYKFTEEQWNKMSASQRKEWMDYREQAITASKRFENIALELGGINFKGINLSGVKDTKSKDQYKAEADRYAQINQLLDKNNQLLQRNKSLQDLAGDDLAKKLPLMKEEIDLNKQRQQSLHSLNNERRKELLELEKTLSGQGFKFQGEGDNRIITNLNNIKGKTKEVEEQFKRYIDLQSNLLPQASQEWWNLENAIQKINLSIVDLQNKIGDKILDNVRKLIQAEKDYDEEQLRQLEEGAKNRLSRLEKNLYMVSEKEFNDLQNTKIRAIEEEIRLTKSKLKDKRNDIVLQSQLIALESELAYEQSKTYRRLKDFKEVYEEIANARIKSLQDELDALEEKSALEAEIEERQKRQLEIQELLLKIQNLSSQKTVQQLKQNTDGTWRFEYVADQEAIDKTQKELKDKQESLDKWENDNSIRHKKEQLQAQIKYEQDILKAKQDSYEKQQKAENDALKIERDALDRHYRNMDDLVADRLDELRKTNNNKWDLILQDVIQKLGIAESSYQQLLGLKVSIDDMIRQITSSISSMPSATGKRNVSEGLASTNAGYSSDWSDMYFEARSRGDYQAMEYANRQANIERGIGDKVTATTDIEYIKRNGAVRDVGGILPSGKFAVNLSGKDEQILSPEQTKAWLKLVDNLPKLSNLVNLKVPDISKVKTNSDIPTQQIFNISKLEFPNVNDAQGVIESIKSLPQLTIQKVRTSQ